MSGLLLLAWFALGVRTLHAQTIRGKLLDLESDRPIATGLVMMFTEGGDSVTSTLSDPDGAFSVGSPEPGSFVLIAAALGYRETPAGMFELGDGGTLDVMYRLAPAPLPIDEVVVSLSRRTLQHHLIRNGFVRRFQRGLGVFVTPYDIEKSAVASTEQLLSGVPGIRVATASIVRNAGDVDIAVPRPDIGETVQIQGAAGWCTPTVYVDGVRTFYDTDPHSMAIANTISGVAPLSTVEAIEVYRRPAEIPVEYSTGPASACGVLVVWTKSGLAPGQGPTGRTGDYDAAGPRLPHVDATGAPPLAGEAVRMALSSEAVGAVGVPSPWGGTFIEAREESLIVSDDVTSRTLAIPVDGIEELQVRRSRPPGHAFVRGAIAGAATGAFVWGGLSLLCAWSDCNGAVENPWLPATLTGVTAGWLVQLQGPGTRWVRSVVPDIGPSPQGGARSLSLHSQSRRD